MSNPSSCAMLFAAGLAVFQVAPALAASSPPCAGRFVVDRGDPLAGPIVVSAAEGTLSVGDQCEPEAAWIDVRGKRTLVRGRWASCTGVSGEVRLRGAITDSCSRLRGAIILAGETPRRRRFTAQRSACGDGVVDASGGEECDGAGCEAGLSCVACRCAPPAPISPESCADASAATIDAAATSQASWPALPDLEMLLGSLRAQYNTSDACIPISLRLTNQGSDRLVLSADQAATLRRLTVGVYGRSTRVWELPLSPLSGVLIEQGPFLEPGQSLRLGAIVDRERVALYSVPPLGGGVVRRAFSVQGPFPGVVGLFDITKVDILVDVDFGVLPATRVAEPGAGTAFVPGEVMVRFVPGTPLATAERIIGELGCHIADGFLGATGSGPFLVAIPFDRTTVDMMAAFVSRPEVLRASQNTLFWLDRAD